MPDVSVLLPCYNASETLEETLIPSRTKHILILKSSALMTVQLTGPADLLEALASRKIPVLSLSDYNHSGVVEAANTGLKSAGGRS